MKTIFEGFSYIKAKETETLIFVGELFLIKLSWVKSNPCCTSCSGRKLELLIPFIPNVIFTEAAQVISTTIASSPEQLTIGTPCQILSLNNLLSITSSPP